ncbi:glycoside hydrolase family 2 protein [Trichoderma citrinoviride]|uniref:Beta-mannosidase B n=1 Tax=Trichoderma citrinoviride TaxID=58853 RepID=A0A2T4B9L4_9HYPO|nr:glycoside hydrolase family 2 protein [Trichoderma citrinoviride]PTB66015.1 glycoside hydrolase family 2 protein [Trichoderma citrinoviride]
MAPRKIIPVDAGWQFGRTDVEKPEFRPVSQFPTNVHLDLLHHKLIPDPFIGKNELDVQWVGEVRAWQYRTSFKTPKLGSQEKAVLAFDGLDTFAEVLLNDKKILETDNMFIPERVDVTALLNEADKDNQLVITFDSAYLRGWERVEQIPEHKWGVWNGDHSRLAVRKAQYHWGWDWGPTLLTCGPWKPINLEVYESRLADLYANVTLDDTLKSAKVELHAETEGKASKVRFELSLGETVLSDTVDVSKGGAVATLTISNPELWYPARYGKQPLYTAKATLLDGNEEVDALSKRIGIRKVELVQKPLEDQPGTSFFFKVNNIPIFCGGSCWIPADNFTPRITKEKYQNWIKLMVEGNQSMIRIWGGGVYEDENLLDACDEQGILVWVDFLFACGNYPCNPEMLQSVEREARANVKIMRHHPSIVIYAGNNEDYQFQESEGLTYDVQDKDPQSWLKSDFPARYIYEYLLVQVCQDLVPATFYHYGSPWGGKTSSDPTIGDIHQWNVWHGSQARYQDFDKLMGRFVSEFGLEAFPSARTIDAALPKGKDDPDRHAQSDIVDFHNKADGHERRIALYLAENIPYVTSPLEQYIYSTQLVQAECLSSAFRLWRRQWKGPGREYCSGALLWQLNDCWPVTSWAICDYYLRPKLAYYTVKRELLPITVGIKRTEHRHPKSKYTRVDVEVSTKLEIWASNFTLDEVKTSCVVKAWDVETAEEVYSETIAASQQLPGNRTTELKTMEVPVKIPNAGLEGRTVVAAYLYQDGKLLARYVDWPQPLKHVHFQQPQSLKAKLSEDGSSVTLSSEVPVKGVALEVDDEAVNFDDNLVDLVPGEEVVIGVTGASKSTTMTTRYLGMRS